MVVAMGPTSFDRGADGAGWAVPDGPFGPCRSLGTGAASKRMTTLTAAFVPLEIAQDRCKGCELCVHACPKHCLALDLELVNVLGYHPVRVTDVAACTSCAFCARVCPDAVFSVYAPPKPGTDR